MAVSVSLPRVVAASEKSSNVDGQHDRLTNYGTGGTIRSSLKYMVTLGERRENGGVGVAYRDLSV